MEAIKKTILAFALFYSLSASAQWNELGGVNSLNTLVNKQELVHTALYADDMGNVYAAGMFKANNPADYDTTRYFVKWNGSAWKKLVPPANHYTYTVAPYVDSIPAIGFNPFYKILSIVSYSSNHLYAAGQFVNASGLQYVGEWNGTYWVELGGQNALAANGSINSLCVDSTGNLYAAGGFVNSSGLPYVAKWNGSQWSQLGGNFPGQFQVGVYSSVSSICSDGQGNIYACGSFVNAAGNKYVAKWDGNSWAELGDANTFHVNPSYFNMIITADNHGNIYTAGSLLNADNKNYVAKWNGTTWVELTGINGLLTYPYHVTSLSVDKYDNVYALSSNGGNVQPLISKWNGSDWINLPYYTDPNGTADFLSICNDTVGNLYTSTNVYKNPYFRGFVLEYAKAYEVGVEELASENVAIKIYPNPAKESVNIELNNVNKALDLKLTDISGRLIKQIPLAENAKVDVSDLSNGIYFFSIYSNGQHIKTAKIIKE